MSFEPVKLEGQFVKLEPMKMDHVDELFNFGSDPEIWKWYPFSISTLDEMRGYVVDALEQQKQGTQVPMVTYDRNSSDLVATSKFMNIDAKNFRLEIGSTWIDPRWQRSYVNTEMKLLMLTHAFENWGCKRVEFKTDSLNQKSRSAILRLGAKEEGTFRQHMITESGRMRDSVFFSIVDSEWGGIKQRLSRMLKND